MSSFLQSRQTEVRQSLSKPKKKTLNTIPQAANHETVLEKTMGKDKNIETIGLKTQTANTHLTQIETKEALLLMLNRQLLSVIQRNYTGKMSRREILDQMTCGGLPMKS